MKKFKVKNRPKRKYVRKEIVSHSSFSNTLALGVFPLLLMGIAFLATYLISHPPTENISHIEFRSHVPSLSIPTVTFGSSVGYFQYLLNSIAAWTTSAVSSIAHVKITIPWISIDPQPLLISVGQDITIFVSQTITLLELYSSVLIQYEINSLTGVSSLLVELFPLFHQTLSLVGQSIWQVMMVIGHVSVYAAHGMIQFLTATGKEISTAWNGFVYWLGAPFRIAAVHLIQFKPFYDFISSSLQHSTNDLIKNLSTLFHFTSHFSKAS